MWFLSLPLQLLYLMLPSQDRLFISLGTGSPNKLILLELALVIVLHQRNRKVPKTPDELSLVPGTHVIGEENWLQQAVL